MQFSLCSGLRQQCGGQLLWGPPAAWPPLSCSRSSRRACRESKIKRISRKKETGKRRNKKKRRNGKRWTAGRTCSLRHFLMLVLFLLWWYCIYGRTLLASEAAGSLWAAGEATETVERRTEEDVFGFRSLYYHYSALLPQGTRPEYSN